MILGVDVDLIFNNVGLSGYIETKGEVGTGSSEAAGTCTPDDHYRIK